MDYIPGRQLSVVWPNMSQEQKDTVARTLKEYIRQLRQVDIPQRLRPGPVGYDGASRQCESPVFGQVKERRGPFASYGELETFFNSRKAAVLRQEKWSHLSIPEFDTSYPLVLTHQDLNPRNIIVGDDGKLWIVDWGWAGFYPEWWESIAMECQARNEELVWKREDPSWDAIIPVVCGSYPEMEAYLAQIGPALDWR
jgi:thiamine kinase-like enzyme